MTPVSAVENVAETGKRPALVQETGSIGWVSNFTVLAKRHAVYQAARERHPQRWSGNTRNWSPVGAFWLNPEKEKQPKCQAA